MEPIRLMLMIHLLPNNDHWENYTKVISQGLVDSERDVKHCLEPHIQPPAVPPVKGQLSNSTCIKKSWDGVKSSREVWPCAGWPQPVLNRWIIRKHMRPKKRPRLNFSISIYCFALWPYLVKVKQLTLGFNQRNNSITFWFLPLICYYC